AAFRLKLPPDMTRRRIHDVFHAQLLRPYVPNDDERFPGRSWAQVARIPLEKPQSAIVEVVSHRKIGDEFLFYSKWTDG
ncbi:hypothetical protein AURDEDRAFT_39211, partial [Auricularia subglabra TFB-10046 SS5]